MRAILAGAVLALSASLVGFGLWQKSRAEKAEELAVRMEQRALSAEAEVRAHEVSMKALEDHLSRTREDRDRWADVARELETKEGKDETLNPYLRAVLDSLLGSGGSGGVPPAAGP